MSYITQLPKELTIQILNYAIFTSKNPKITYENIQLTSKYFKEISVHESILLKLAAATLSQKSVAEITGDAKLLWQTAVQRAFDSFDPTKNKDFFGISVSLEDVSKKLMLFPKACKDAIESLSFHLMSSNKNTRLAFVCALSSLRKLNISLQTESKIFMDKDLQCIRKSLSSLKEVVLSECKYVSESEYILFIQKFGLQLTSLHLSDCRSIRDQTIQHFPDFPNLVSLSPPYSLSSNGLKLLMDKCPVLKYLKISNSLIAGGTIAYIAQKCPMLEELDISMCENVSDDDIQQLMQNCPKLSILLMRDCRNVTAHGFKDLKTHPHAFRKINFIHCTNLSESVLDDMIDQSPNLEWLEWGDDLSNGMKKKIKQKYPNLKYCNPFLG